MIPLVLSSAGEFVSIGLVGWSIISVTGTICVPAVVLKMSIPLYVPGRSPVTLTLTVGEEGVIPFVALIVSQWPPLAVITVSLQFKGPTQRLLAVTLSVLALAA